MALPRPGTAAYRSGRLPKHTEAVRQESPGASTNGAAFGSRVTPPLELAWDAAKEARSRRAAEDERRAADRAAERRARISGRSWTPSLGNLQNATAASAGTWKVSPLAAPLAAPLASLRAMPRAAAVKTASKRPAPRATPLRENHS